MGFSGEIVVVQGGTRPADRGAFVGVQEEEFLAEWPLKDGWRAIHVALGQDGQTGQDGPEGGEDGEGWDVGEDGYGRDARDVRDDKFDDYWLAEAAELTGAPVLACWVSAGEVAHIRGVSKAGEWDTWLNLPHAATMIVDELLDDVADDLYEEGGQEAVARFRAVQRREMLNRLEYELPLAARKAAEWAAEAGYRVPAGPIEELLSARREDFVQRGFFDLLYRLGLRETDDDPGF